MTVSIKLNGGAGKWLTNTSSYHAVNWTSKCTVPCDRAEQRFDSLYRQGLRLMVSMLTLIIFLSTQKHIEAMSAAEMGYAFMSQAKSMCVCI